MGWRTARALDALLDQLNDAHPHRSRKSDGAIGDEAHKNTVSDHNPDTGGVVRARDFTHDPDNGLDAGQLAEALIRSRDPRIKYVISEGRIASSYPAHGKPAWAWRPYTGLNAHRSHVHVSVVDGPAGDDPRDWVAVGRKSSTPASPIPARAGVPGRKISGVRPVPAPRYPLPRGYYFGPLDGPLASVSGFRHRRRDGKPGHEGLKLWQARMAVRGWDITPDGRYGDETAEVAEAFQREKGLTVDGLIGPETYAAAWEASWTA